MAAAPRFSQDIQDKLVRFAEIGVGIRDAAREIGVAEKTVKRWLLNGKRDPDNPENPYADFYKRIEEARAKFEGDGLTEEMSPEELLRVTSRAARKGSVQAQKLLWEMMGRPRFDGSPDEPSGDEGDRDEDQMKGLDELAARRAAR